MSSDHSRRYHADPAALNAMRRDGMGWGHDLAHGVFHMPGEPRSGVLMRAVRRMRKGDN